MSSLAHRGLQALIAAGLMFAAGCAEPSAPAEARQAQADAPGIYGVYVLDPAASSDYDLSDRCGVPLSSTVVLEGGRWRREARWAPGCHEDGAPGEIVTYAQGGTFTVDGESIELRSSGPEAEFIEAESGELVDGKLTIWGHCEGEDVFVRTSGSPAETKRL